MPHAGGRPSIYTEELAKEICRRIASGRTTLSVSRDDDMPARSTIIDWVLSNPQFSVAYARARDMLLEHWGDEVIEISDDDANDLQPYEIIKGGYTERGTKSDNTVVNRDKLGVDSRKWLLSKLKPGQYGDKIQAEHSGSLIVNINRKPNDEND